LGLAHLLAGVAQLVRLRAAVRFYVPALVRIGILFLTQVQVWWAIFELRGEAQWTFLGFMLILTLPTLLYLQTFLLLPDFDREEQIDLKAIYYESRPWFFALFALIPVASLVREYVMAGFIAADADPLFRLGFLGLALLGLLSPRKRVHEALAPLMLISFVVYIALLFLQLV
jgi:hypothetical protein